MGDRFYKYEIIFVGSWGYHVEHCYRQTLLKWLQETYGYRFIYFDHGSGLRGHRLNRLYASAKIIIGDSCNPGFTQTHYWSDRCPEVLGRGGFLIHPWIKGMDEQFTDQEHLIFYRYGDFEQLRSLIDYYLSHDEERERIRLAGHEYVKAHHTYTHRVMAMLDIIGTGEDWS